MNPQAILDLMRKGWELGAKRDSHAWIEENGLMQGGKNRKVSLLPMKSMLRCMEIQEAPRRPGDPRWLLRYEECPPEVKRIKRREKWQGRKNEALNNN